MFLDLGEMIYGSTLILHGSSCLSSLKDQLVAAFFSSFLLSSLDLFFYLIVGYIIRRNGGCWKQH